MANEIVTGREAERIGLVWSAAFPPGPPSEEALKTARAIGASAASTVKLLRRNLGVKTDGSHFRTQNGTLNSRREIFRPTSIATGSANYLLDYYA